MPKRKSQVLADFGDSDDSDCSLHLDKEFVSRVKNRRMRLLKKPRLNDDSGLDKSCSSSPMSDNSSTTKSGETNKNSGEGSDPLSEREEGELSDSDVTISDDEMSRQVLDIEITKARFHLEKKLIMAKRLDLKKQKELKKWEKSRDEEKHKMAFDPKERSQVRKNFAEKRDKKFLAMSLLNARRERIGSSNQSQHRPGSSSDSRDKESPASSGNKAKPKKPIYACTRDDLNKIQLSRGKVERLFNLPFFDQVAKGCFVRISIGAHNKRPVYRVAEVIDVCETSKIYQFGATRTNKALKLRYGDEERIFRLEYISNKQFTYPEVFEWKKACASKGILAPTKKQVELKFNAINAAFAYEFTEEDIDRMVKEKERFKNNPCNYAMKKAQLRRERDSAICRGDDKSAATIDHEIEELEKRASKLDKKRTATISGISYINHRNRMENAEKAEKAIKEEVKASKGKKIDDPFTRKRTMPSMLFKPASDRDTSSVDADDVMSSAEAAAREKEKEIEEMMKCPDYLYKVHDFDIEIDLDLTLPYNITKNPITVNPVTVSDLALIGPNTPKILADFRRRVGPI